jgi:tetratricopeptide (TPR) repeat protein
MVRQNMFQFLRSPLVQGILFMLLALMALGWAALVQRHRLAQPNYQVRRGEEAIARKDWRTVEAIVSRLELAGFGDQASLLQGKALVARGETARALDALGHIGDNSPMAAPARLLEAQQYMDFKDFGRALQAYQVALGHEPENLTAHWGLAVIYFNIFAWDDCRTECRHVADLDPEDGRPWSALGLIYKETKQYPEAATAYLEALKRPLSDNRRQEVRTELAEVYIAQNDFPKAQELLDADDQKDAYSHLVLQAECDWHAGRRQDAVDKLNSALKQGGATLATLAGPCRDVARLGSYLLEMGQKDKALETLKYFEPKCTKDPEFARVLLKTFQELKMDNEATKQEAKVENLERLRDALDRYSRKAYADRTDNESRRRAAELCTRLGKSELGEQWRVAGITIVPQ